MNRHEMIAEILNIPPEIMKFAYDVFSLIEIRGCVGRKDGLKFEIRTDEGKHKRPHLHAKYAEHEISISIEDGVILKGNLPPKQSRLAIKWVRSHKEKLLGDWYNLAINRNIPMTESQISSDQEFRLQVRFLQ